MNRYTLSHRSQVIVLSLLALLALVLLLAIRGLPLPALPIPGSGTSNESDVGGTAVELPPGIHPADRKFYADKYVIDRSTRINTYSLETVHPADRKFFYGTAATTSGAHNEIHPADRKFYTPVYGYRE